MDAADRGHILEIGSAPEIDPGRRLSSGHGRLPRRFRQLWLALALSNVGDGVRVAALPLLAVAISPKAFDVALVAVFAWGPWLLLGLPAGALVDRMDRVRIAIAMQVTRAVAAGALVLAVVTQAPYRLLVLYVVAAVIGGTEVFVDTTVQALVPNAVADDQLEAANGRLTVAETVTNQMIGPSLGAMLFQVAPAAPFGLDAVSFVASAWLLLRLRVRRTRGAEPNREVFSASFLSAIGEGLRYLWRDRVLRPMALWVASINLCVSAGNSVLVLLAIRRLGLGAAEFGLLFLFEGIGGVIAGMVTGRLVAWVGRGAVLAGSAIGAGAGFLAMSFTRSPVVAYGLEIFLGLTAVSFTIIGRSVRQSHTPDSIRGRVTSAYRVLGYGSVPLGALLGGLVSSQWGVQIAFRGGGAALMLSAMALGPGIVRRLRDPGAALVGKSSYIQEGQA